MVVKHSTAANKAAQAFAWLACWMCACSPVALVAEAKVGVLRCCWGLDKYGLAANPTLPAMPCSNHRGMVVLHCTQGAKQGHKLDNQEHASLPLNPL